MKWLVLTVDVTVPGITKDIERAKCYIVEAETEQGATARMVQVLPSGDVIRSAVPLGEWAR